MRKPRGWRLTAALVALTALLGGCKTIQQMMPSHRAAQERADKLQDLQLKVMRFADEYVGRTNEVLNKFKSESVTPEERLTVQNWKLQQATSAYIVASGPNSLANALDMVVLASLSRMVLDDAWVAERWGARAIPVQETYRALEASAYGMVEDLLTASQMARLREVLIQWRAQNPNVRAVAYIHFRDFAKSVGAPKPGEEGTAGNLFAVLNLDPFSSLDPAIREITQTRQLAERAIYYVQRAPELIDMQVERLTDQLAVMPETKTLLADFGRVSLIGTASDNLVRSLPGLLDQQRDALIVQLTHTMNEQSATIGKLAGELRGTLQAGTETANALHGTLESVERITAQFAPKPGAPEEPKGPPFDIRQYTEMLREASVAVRQLDELAQRADTMAPVLRTATQEASARVNSLLNHLFVLALLLILAAAVAALLAALAYRRLSARMARRAP